MEIIRIKTEYIKLEQLLKWAGIVESGAVAKAIIIKGDVKVNGNIELQRGKKIKAGDIIELNGTVLKVE